MAAHTTTGGPGEGGGEGTVDTSGVQQPVESTSTTGGEIHADTNGMRSGARMFESTSDYAAGIESRFVGGTGRLEGVWGTDDTGKRFETEYRKRIVQATEALKAIREGLGTLPESVGGWAQSYAQAEEDNATIADGLAREADTQASQLYQPGTGAGQPVETRQYAVQARTASVPVRQAPAGEQVETRRYARYMKPVWSPVRLAKPAPAGDGGEPMVSHGYAMVTHRAQGPVRLAKAPVDGEQVETRRYARYATPVRLDQSLVRQASTGDGGDQPVTRMYAMQPRTVHGPVQQPQAAGDGGAHVETRQYSVPPQVHRRPIEPEPIRNADGTVTMTDWIPDPKTGELLQVVRRVPMPEPTYGLGTAQVTGSIEGVLPVAPAPAHQPGAAEGVGVAYGTTDPAPEPIRNADGTVTMTDWITDPATGELVEVVRRVPPESVGHPPSAPPG